LQFRGCELQRKAILLHGRPHYPVVGAQLLGGVPERQAVLFHGGEHHLVVRTELLAGVPQCPAARLDGREHDLPVLLLEVLRVLQVYAVVLHGLQPLHLLRRAAHEVDVHPPRVDLSEAARREEVTDEIHVAELYAASVRAGHSWNEPLLAGWHAELGFDEPLHLPDAHVVTDSDGTALASETGDSEIYPLVPARVHGLA